MGKSSSLGIGISTIGRWKAVRQALTDIANQEVLPTEVILCDQQNTGEGRAIIAEFQDAFPLSLVTSGPGASKGRNTILLAFNDVTKYVLFLNDTSRIDPGFISGIFADGPLGTVTAFPMRDLLGPRNSIPSRGSGLTLQNVWGAIEPATVFDRQALAACGGFDENIGTGAPSPWAAGEGTDAILRMHRTLGARFSVSWRNNPVVHAQPEFANLPQGEARHKARGYGRGTGYIYRRWGYPWPLKAKTLAGALVSPLHRRSISPALAFQLFLGRAEGLLGKPFRQAHDHTWLQ